MATKIKNGLYKRGNSWYICVKVNGEQIRKSFGSDKRQAELALAEVKKQRAVAKINNDWSGLEKLTTPKKAKTFQEAAADYLAERIAGKASTIRTYNEHLNNYLLPVFGRVQVARISEEQVAQFQADLSGRLSACRVNSCVTLLRAILKTCVRRKYIEENPCDGVDRLKEDATEIDPLSLEELELALSKISNLYRPLFICLAWTGARPGELMALRWEDVDFERGELRINKARVRGTEDAPKTKSSVRYIPMLPPVRECLTKHRRERAVIDPHAHVFVARDGQPLDQTPNVVWANALKKAKLKHRPSYQLRHTFASISLQQGVNPGWVAKVLGHSTLQTTYRHYARFIKDPNKANETLMAGLFAPANSAEVALSVAAK